MDILNKISVLPDELKNIIKLYYGGGEQVEKLKKFFKLTNQEQLLNKILNPLEYLRENRTLTPYEASDYWDYGYERNQIRKEMRKYFKTDSGFNHFLNNLEIRDYYFNELGFSDFI